MYKDDYVSKDLCGHNRNHDSGIRHRCMVVVKVDILRNAMRGKHDSTPTGS